MGSGNDVRFFFGTHADEADARATQEHFDWCTVYVPELAGWSKAAWVQYRAVSLGDVPAHLAIQLMDFSFRSFHYAEMEMIEGSGKRIEFIDIPHGHGLQTTTNAVHHAYNRLGYFDGDWPALMAENAKLAEAFNLVYRYRDEHLVNALCELDARLQNERILVRLGTSHSQVAQHARDRGLNVQSAFERSGQPHAPEGLIAHYGQMGRPTPSVVLARYALTCMIHRFCWEIIPKVSLTEAAGWIARTTARFAESEIAELWQRFRDDEAEAVQALVLLIRAREPKQ